MRQWPFEQYIRDIRILQIFEVGVLSTNRILFYKLFAICGCMTGMLPRFRLAV
jgi:hypothetical protein